MARESQRPVNEHAREGTEVVDGFRGLAIVLVFGYHTWLFSWYTPPWPFDVLARTGYMGVELFFVISGFCLFFPYARSALGGTPAPSAAGFAYRRLVKIGPSYLLALAATVAVAVPAFPDARDAALPLLQHLLFLQTFWNEPFRGANSVLWSLGIEIQFYLIFPLLAALFARRPLASALCMIAGALAFRYGLAQCCLSLETIVRQLPAFLDLFALGMLAAYGVAWARIHHPQLIGGNPRFAVLAAVLAFAGFALLSSANGVQYDLDGRAIWNLAGRTAFGAVCAGLIATACFPSPWLRRTIANPIFVFLSVVSYNLYLWHTLIQLWLLHHHLPPSAIAIAHNDAAWRPWFIATATVASLAVATSLTYLVERPLLAAARARKSERELAGEGRAVTEFRVRAGLAAVGFDDVLDDR